MMHSHLQLAADMSHAVVPLLLDCTAKGTVVLLAVLAATRLMRRAPAAARHLIWAMAMAGLLLLPALAALLPAWQVLPAWSSDIFLKSPLEVVAHTSAQPASRPVGIAPALGARINGPDEANRAAPSGPISTPGVNEGSPPAAAPTSIAAPEQPTKLTRAAVSPVRPAQAGAGEVRAAPPKARRSLDFVPWIMLGWISGALFGLCPPLVSSLVLRRLSRRAKPLVDRAWQDLLDQLSDELELNHRPTLLAGQQGAMPMTWGLLRPKVLLPAEADAWPARWRRVVLAHELAHVKRRDCLWLLVARLTCAIYWFNPLAWMAVRRVRAEAERACDDRVLLLGEAAPDYAEQLLHVVTNLHPCAYAIPTALAMARKCTLEGRLRAILDATLHRRRLTGGWAGTIILLLAGLILLTSILRVSAQPANRSDHQNRSSPASQPSVSVRAVPLIVLSDTGYPRSHVYFGTEFPSYNSLEAGTDRLGRFELKIKPTDPTHWYAYSPATRKYAIFTIPAGNVTRPLVVKLNLDEAQLSGRLIDRQDRGVVGAKIQIRVRAPSGQQFLSMPWPMEDNGYYTVGAVPVGDGMTVEARVRPADGEPGPWSPPVATRAGQIAIQMPELVDPHPRHVSDQGPWPVYAGTIKDEGGRAIAGARVELMWQRPRRLGTWRRDAVSDTRGRWSVAVPPDSNVIHLRVSHAGYMNTLFENSALEPPPLEQLRDGTAVSVLKRGLVLSGTVRDARGKPIADAHILTQTRVESYANGGGGPTEDSTMGRSAADGAFRIEGMPPGPRDLMVYAVGCAPTVVPVEITATMKPVQITATPAGRIEGTILDSEGKPVAGIPVRARGWEFHGSRSLRSASITDATGHFVLDDLPTEGILQVGYGGQGYEWTETLDLKPRSEPYRLTIARGVSQRSTVIGGSVVDDATGKPIGQFTLAEGIQLSGQSEMVFPDRTRLEVKSDTGAFRRTSYQSPFAVRVWARGYLAAQTAPLKTGETHKPFVLRLRHGDPFSGTLLGTDGKPAAGASVAWIGPGRHAFVTPDGRLDDQYIYAPEIVVNTDAEGRFELPPSASPGTIFAIGINGYVEQLSNQFKSGSNLSLIPWAKIQGRCGLSANSSEPARLAVRLQDPQLRSRNAAVNWMLTKPAHPDGSFVFEYVPAAPVAMGVPSSNGLSHRVLLEPKPGETQTVQIGGEGRDIVGHLELPSDLGFDRVYSTSDGNRPVAVIDLRPTTDARDDTSLRPEDQDPTRILFAGEVQNDNRLRIARVPPGDYVLHVTARAAPQPNSCGIPVALAETAIPISVVGATSPLDLGTVTLKTIDHPKTGSLVPELQGRTVDGKPFSLSQLRGKTVLIDFWASWCSSCRAQMPHLKQLWKQYASDGGKLVVVGINLDYEVDDARKYVDEEHLPWPNIYTQGGWGDANPTLRRFGVTAIPSFWLISPEGRVLARDIPAAALDQMIDNTMKR